MTPSTLTRITRRLRGTPRDSRFTLKDRLLAYRLYRTMEHDLALARVQGIHFYVKSGTVTLYGTVHHDLDRMLLVSLVRQISGVKEVIEHLQCVEQPRSDADAEITLQL